MEAKLAGCGLQSASRINARKVLYCLQEAHFMRRAGGSPSPIFFCAAPPKYEYEENRSNAVHRY